MTSSTRHAAPPAAPPTERRTARRAALTRARVRRLMAQIALVSDVDALDAQGTAAGAMARRRAVQLSTIHGAKGLEFDLVFVAGCEEGLLPHYYCTENEEEVEQERRLLYVAMTRAKERLVLTHTGVRARWGKVTPVERSRFLQDLPADLCVQAEPRWRRPRWNGGSNGGEGSRWRREAATAKDADQQ